jgi:DNA-binding NtrC family response regulator
MPSLFHSLHEEGVPMPGRLHLTLELPDEVVRWLPGQELTAKAKEVLVMEILREHQVSQGKAAEILGISRHDLFELRNKYCFPIVNLTPEGLKAELKQPFPRS